MDKNKLTGIIGTGAAGNNVASMLSLYGFLTMAYNCSQDDMIQASVDVKFTPGNTNGAGKERSFSNSAFKKESMTFLELVSEKFKETRMIIIITSTAGGTGSGVAPMMAALLKKNFPDKIILVIGLAPRLDEDIKGISNTLEFVRDMEQKAKVPYTIYGNGKSKCNHIQEQYNEINEEVCTAVRILSREFYSANITSNMDERDFAKLFVEAARFNVCPINFISSLELNDQIINQIDDNKCLSMGSSQIIRRAGVFLSLTNDQYSEVDLSFTELQKSIGKIGETFKQCNEVCDDEDCPDIAFILTQLPPPIEELNRMSKIVSDYTKKLAARPTLEGFTFETLDNVTVMPTDVKIEKTELNSDILDEF